MATRTQTTDDARKGSGRSLFGGGTEGNELLTNATGAILILLLAVLGVTIVRLHQLIWVHLFVGVLLIPPVILKMSSTGYRFMRYYTGESTYTAKGPPPTALRLLAPLLVLLTVIVFTTGVVLLLAGPGSRQPWFMIHKVSFFGWLAVTAIHVLAHIQELPAALRADYDRPELREDVPGRSGRRMALAGAIVLGVVVAVIAIPQFGVWVNGMSFLHH